jgi:pyruvate dehydrogenase E2 component (dihydrolipoamide acetyltransferase)
MAIPIIVPKQGQSVETCIIVDWYVKKGDNVSKGDLIYTYETDKSTFDEEAPADGILLDIFNGKGEEVPVLSTVAVIGEQGENIDEFRSERRSEDASPNLSQKSEDRGQKSEAGIKDKEMLPKGNEERRLKISPRAAQMAANLNIDISSIKGTGPNGRIIEIDILAFKKGKAAGKQELGENISEERNKEWEIRKLSNIRQIISENIYDSLRNSAQLTHHTSANATKIIDYRNKIKKLYEKGASENITLNDLICFAVIKAIKSKPEINSHLLGISIKTFKKVHLGFAVDTERGLMVPVIKNADDYNINELSARFRSLAENCRKGDIDPELLKSTEASFTVSNLGAFGVEMFTPILNLPQTGILGINNIVNRPAMNEKGEIEILQFVGLSLTYDHRAIDGAPASAFLKEVKEQIENINVKM